MKDSRCLVLAVLVLFSVAVGSVTATQVALEDPIQISALPSEAISADLLGSSLVPVDLLAATFTTSLTGQACANWIRTCTRACENIDCAVDHISCTPPSCTCICP